MLLSGKTAPSFVMPTISMRAFLSPADELLVSLAFFPPARDANDKVVGRMDGDNALPDALLYSSFVGRGLVPILKHVRIVLNS